MMGCSARSPAMSVAPTSATAASASSTASSTVSPTASPTASSAPRGYDRADWASAFGNVDSELTAVPLKAASGSIPAELKGTLYSNGPGRLERGRPIGAPSL